MVSCELDDACDEEALALPREAANAREDEATTASFRGLMWAQTRASSFRRVQELLERGEIAWTGLTETRWAAILDRLHRPRVEALAESRLSAMTPTFEQGAEALREQLERDDSEQALERARSEIRGLRGRIAESFDTQRAGLVDSLPTLRGEEELCPELLATEEEVLDDLLDDLVKRAVLDAFDETFAEFLGD